MKQTEAECCSEFIIQAAAGAYMAIKRAGLPPGTAHVGLAQYLNDCWMNLMREDDPYVLEKFAGIGHRSPVCTIHIVFQFGNHLLDVVERTHIGTSGRGGKAEEDVTRAIVWEIMRSELGKVNLVQLFSHNCTGDTLEEERAQWRAKGCPEEGVFTLNTRN